MPALETYYRKSVIPNNTTSAELATAVTDEVGTDFLVFSNSPNLTGIPTAPTAAPNTNTTQIATTEYVDNAIHDPVTVTDSAEIDFTLTNQNITASIVPGSIDETKLDSSVNISLDRADQLYYEPTDVKTANYSASTNEAVLCDTTGGSFTVTLPASGQVKIVDAGGDSQTTGFGSNPLTVATLGLQTILGDSDGITLDSGITSITFQYIDNDWKIIDLVVPKIQIVDWDGVINKPNVALVDANETVTGSYTFTGPLILPNNSRVNDIEHFYQTTKPTTRGDGSALVAGDRWYKPTDNGIPSTAGNWIWSGSDWVSAELYSMGEQARNISVGFTNVFAEVFHWDGSILIEELMNYAGSSSGTYDSSNYWSQRVYLVSNTQGGGAIQQIGSEVITLQSFGQFKDIQTINTVFSLANKYSFQLTLLKTGAPSNYGGGASISFRRIHP